MSFALDFDKIAAAYAYQQRLIASGNFNANAFPLITFPNRPHWENCIMVTQIGLIILNNLLFISLICFTRRLRKVTFAVAASLSVGDLLVGCITIPTAYSAENQLILYDNYRICLANYIGIIALPTVPIVHLVIIGAEKFITIQYPLRYNQIVNKRFAIISCTLAWLLPLMYGIVPTVIWIVQNEPRYPWFDYCTPLVIYPDGFMFSSTIVILVPSVAAISGLYIRILVIARKQSNKVFAEQSAQVSASQRKRVIRGMATIIVLLVYFIISWIPLAVLLLVPGLSVSKEYWSVAKLLAFSNSWLDPVMYTIGSKEIRNAVLRKFGKQKVDADFSTTG
ncbi:DgyrCDS3340 [Dimorphilus gyrociliatus]|uniref:DgyrCDS3340 n=1 Tax=Dimorphilus gyrociliatus TaxID=2664684 RepID=A0A7I8VEU2_9ANNE|nr:DgyrCDS3340 [Dimorphilus gyrociliatus]